MYLALPTAAGAHTELGRAFAAAEPFPHLVIRDALGPEGEHLVDAFPGPEWDGWHRFGDEYQAGKVTCQDIGRMPEALRDLIHELSDAPFLTFLQEVSGIDALLPDPWLEGGGLHASGPGGVLGVHTDFHLYRRLGLYRRLNLLLYLNPGWTEQDGGALELYRPGGDTPGSEPESVVRPDHGTMVLFRTDDRSPHGFTRPVAPGRFRRSVALYYYTATEAEGYSGDTNTYWRQGRETGLVRRSRQLAYQGLIQLSRSLAMVAHRVDPKLARRRPD